MYFNIDLWSCGVWTCGAGATDLIDEVSAQAELSFTFQPVSIHVNNRIEYFS